MIRRAIHNPARCFLLRLAICAAGLAGSACGYSIPDSAAAGASLLFSMQSVPQLSALDDAAPSPPPLTVTASASTVLTHESVTFTASGGTAPYAFQVSAGGGTISTAGVYTAGAVLGGNTIRIVDSAGSESTTSVTVQGGQGNGTFNASANYAAGNAPFMIKSGDFTGDGVPDLVHGTGNPPHMRVYEGNGDGTFQAGIANGTGLGADARSTVVGDFDRDGNLDMAGGTTGGKFVVFLGNADITFQPRADYAEPGGPLGIVAGDMDNDGILDIVAANIGTDNAGFWKGNGDGTFQPAVAFGSHNAPRRVEIADFNNDGNLDAVFSNTAGAPSTSAGVTVYLGNGDGTFQSRAEYATPNDTAPLVLGDFNGDSRVDIVALSGIPGGEITVLLGNGDGTFQAGLASFLPASGGPAFAAACDYNGDSRMDLAAADQDNNTVVVLFGDGAGGFTTGPQLSSPGGPINVHCRDLNGDGRMDIAASSGTSVDLMRVYIAN